MVCKILSELLNKEGETVFFFTTKFNSGESPADIFQIPALTKRGGFWKKIVIPFYLLWGTIFAVRYFRKIKPDVVNFLHSNYLFVPVMLAAKILKIPTVFTFLDYYLICDRGTFLLPDGQVCDQLEGKVCQRCASKTKLIERRLMKWLRKDLKGIITFTETSKKRLIKHGFLREKIKVVYIYAIPKEFEGKTRNKKPDSVLVTAFFSPHKGLHIVLKAWQKVVRAVPSAKLTVVGSGSPEDKQRIENLVKELGIGDSVEFLGQKENEEVLNMILEHEIAAVPEQWPSEFGPLVLVEALALGTPAVASRVGSAPDFIEDGVNGFLVEYDNPSQFAGKIICLLEGKEMAKLMGEKAKEAGKILFSYNQGKETLSFYKELISKR